MAAGTLGASRAWRHREGSMIAQVEGSGVREEEVERHELHLGRAA